MFAETIAYDVAKGLSALHTILGDCLAMSRAVGRQVSVTTVHLVCICTLHA
jgi:hypothetical protein